jgi:hypothetical protein
LGWSLGGEAHVFVADDRYARSLYGRLTGKDGLDDSLARRSLIPVQPRRRQRAEVFSASGSTPATLTLARFHAPGTCGFDAIVTELVLAFPPAGSRSPNAPPPHTPVVAALGEVTFTSQAESVQPPLERQNALDLLNRVVERALRTASLLRPLVLDDDRAADAGEVVPLGFGYGVGFRARALTTRGDTVLVTGVASTDREMRRLRWIVQPRTIRLTRGMIPRATHAVRYSLRGAVAPHGRAILVNEVADVSPRNSRATALDAESGHVVAAQPLALRCP